MGTTSRPALLPALLLALAACGDGSPPPPPVTGTASAPAPEVAASRRVQELAGGAWEDVGVLVDRFGERVTGTVEERETARWIGERMAAFGLAVDEQRFPLPVLDHAVVVHGEPEIALPGLVQPGAARLTVAGALIDGGDSTADELAAVSFAGKVLLLRRGELDLAQRVRAAESGGAAGVVVYNDIPSLFQDELGGSALPVVGISKPRGDQLRKLLAEGEVEVTIQADQYSQNIIGTIGSGEPLVILGAHYDSVSRSPGANDNATGVAALLAVARELAELELPYEVRFVAFGAEERQLIGSIHYVAALSPAERDRLALMLNFDSIGKGPLGIDGSDSVVEAALAAAGSEEIELVRRQPRAGTRSDHAPFAEIGVPHAYLFGTVLTRIHSPDDTLDDVESLRLGEAAAIALELLTDPAGLPASEPETVDAAVAGAAA